MATPYRLDPSDGILQRMRRGQEKVEERLAKAVLALEQAGVEYAIIGGNAVAAWVATIDESAVRQTRDVDILAHRGQFHDLRAALESVGFVYRHVAGLDIFLDGPDAKAGDAVHVVYAEEKVLPDHLLPTPPLAETITMAGARFIPLPDLVRMKLVAFRRKDQVHLADMVQTGLIDQSWTAHYPPELAERLQSILDDPDA